MAKIETTSTYAKIMEYKSELTPKELELLKHIGEYQINKLTQHNLQKMFTDGCFTPVGVTTNKVKYLSLHGRAIVSIISGKLFGVCLPYDESKIKRMSFNQNGNNYKLIELWKNL